MNKVDFKILYKLFKKDPNHKIFDKVFQKTEYFYYLIKEFFERNEEIPYDFINKTSKNIHYSYLLILNFLNKKKEPPSELYVKNIFNSKFNKKYCPKIIISYLKNKIEIPEIFIKNIFKWSPKDSYFVIKKLFKYDKFDSNKELIDQLTKNILENPEISYLFYELLKNYKKEIPPNIIKSILKSPKYSYYFVIFYLLKNNKEIPYSFIRSISKDENYSFRLAISYIDSNSEVPEKLLNSILKNIELTYEFYIYLYNYGKKFLTKELENKIFDTITKNYDYTYKLSLFLLENNDKVPQFIEDKIINDKIYLYEYCINCINYNKINHKVLKRTLELYGTRLFDYLISNNIEIDPFIFDHFGKLSKNFHYDAELISHLFFKKGYKEFTNEQIKTISKYPYLSYYFAFRLIELDKKVPLPFEESIKSDLYLLSEYIRKLAENKKNVKNEFIDILFDANYPIYKLDYFLKIFKQNNINSDYLLKKYNEKINKEKK